jgi:hypothetical protein
MVPAKSAKPCVQHGAERAVSAAGVDEAHRRLRPACHLARVGQIEGGRAGHQQRHGLAFAVDRAHGEAHRFRPACEHAVLRGPHAHALGGLAARRAQRHVIGNRVEGTHLVGVLGQGPRLMRIAGGTLVAHERVFRALEAALPQRER